MEVAIIGAGMGGLTLALQLHRQGIRARVYEAAAELRAIGAGISILPHASKLLCELGLEDALARVAVTTQEATLFNRYGQLVYAEPTGRYAGYDYPQFQIHRGDLQQVLLEAVRERLGEDIVRTGWRFVRAEQDEQGATAYFVDPAGRQLEPQKADVVVGADGVNSALRKQLYPDEGPAIYSGVNMWRGVTPWKPFLKGANHVRAGWLASGKMVIYPIRNNIDSEGRQLINWVAEIETPNWERQDWNKKGRLEDFIHVFEDWRFDWLDVPALIRGAESILEYPMVDRDPLEQWSFGRLTLLGDAAHPMYPRGSNGAGQAMLDAASLARHLAEQDDAVKGLKAYEEERLPPTSAVVLANRSTPPDVILKEVYERTGDRPFERIEDVISQEEMRALSQSYQRVAGYDKRKLAS